MATTILSTPGLTRVHVYSTMLLITFLITLQAIPIRLLLLFRSYHPLTDRYGCRARRRSPEQHQPGKEAIWTNLQPRRYVPIWIRCDQSQLWAWQATGSIPLPQLVMFSKTQTVTFGVGNSRRMSYLPSLI